MDSQRRHQLEKLNVLVLDDNRHMRALVKSILHALGIKQTVEAGDAAEAFKELQHFAADLIICDWHMEPLDGLDFVRLVRTARDSPNPFVPILMMTGHSEYQLVCQARDAGVNEFLTKPISAKSVYMRILSVIENPRPFVRSATYFGPDRRRQDHGPPRGVAERRKDRIAAASEGALNPDDIDALLKS